MVDGKNQNMGGVQAAGIARQPVGAVRPDPEPVVIAEGRRAGFSRLIDDPDQVGKAAHTIDTPIGEAVGEGGAVLQPTRTPKAPFQDAQASPDAASVWTSAKSPEPAPPQTKAPHPGGLEAPPHPALDPNQKTDATHDPTADDPGNGAD